MQASTKRVIFRLCVKYSHLIRPPHTEYSVPTLYHLHTCEASTGFESAITARQKVSPARHEFLFGSVLSHTEPTQLKNWDCSFFGSLDESGARLRPVLIGSPLVAIDLQGRKWVSRERLRSTSTLDLGHPFDDQHSPRPAFLSKWIAVELRPVVGQATKNLVRILCTQ